nr:unnamed protein product [Callosobruchus chinensis]
MYLERIKDKGRWTKIHKALQEHDIPVRKAVNTSQGVKVYPSNISSHRELTRQLDKSEIEFTTFQVSEDRDLSVVLRGVNESSSDQEILDELRVKFPSVKSVHRMRRDPYKMSEIEQELQLLIRNRGSVKAKLTSLEKFISKTQALNLIERPSIQLIELRFKSSESLLIEFDKIQVAIEEKCLVEHLDEQMVERSNFEERYFAAQAFLSEIIANESQNNVRSLSEADVPRASNHTPQSNYDPLQNVFIPKIKIPTFSGEFKNWISFKNNFHSTILSNVNLNDYQKWQFLKASLSGYALRVVEGSDSHSQPFTAAWTLLCDKFDKKQFLMDSHFKSLFNLPSVKKENYSQFSLMLDELSVHITALDDLKLTKETLYDSIIIHVASEKLDKSTRREWKDFRQGKELSTLSEFLSFLKDRLDVLQSLEDDQLSNNASAAHHSSKFSSFNKNSQMHLTLNKTIKCNYCKGDHTIFKCSEFLGLSIDQRLQKVKALKLCENCLLTGHETNRCRLQPCSVCKVRGHNSLLHKTKAAHTSSQNSETMNMLVRPNSSTVLDMEHSNQVLLSTIVCQIADYAGGLHTCRALLDSGAQSNLITEGFCSKLNIPLNSTKLSIIGINQTKSNLTKKCEFTISSNFNDFSCKISCLVVPTITLSVPSQHFNISHWSIPDNLNLADPGFECPREVDLLLGANIFWDLLLDGKISLGKNMPTLRNTRFGWILTGTIPLSNNLSLCNFAKVNVPEDEQLTKFWELENVKHEHPLMSKEDMICESLFKKDTFRLDNGQFVVKLPLKHSPNLLGDSKTNAIRRFHALERKFSDSKFKDLYFDFIHEYADLGHMRKISDDSGVITYFLPHHGILKESVTTKLRTVFDGSCPSSSGWSLNDLQYIGPKVQNDIIDILLRFRTYTYVVSADVSKMYRQILIHPDHRSLQQILWRESPSEDFSVYQLQTVTYGTRAAPYLAIRCIRQLAEDNSEQFPLASKTILEDIYVDDVLTGSNDLKELKTRCNNIYSILQSASLILRKWNSNCPEVISDFEKSTISNSVLTIGNQDSCKTLGIQWTNHSDTLSYKIKPFQPPTIITKRYILSTISQIYDPLGLLGPSIIVCKIMIQKLWSLRITWDAEVPPALKKQWLHFHKNLSCFNSLLVPRNAVFNNYALKEIHCFCDASKDAYATCIYMRSVNKQGDYNVQLLCAKTKVAPLKSVTIPKLELKLIHVTAFCLRFTYNLKNKLNKHVGILTPHEIDRANFSKQYVSQLHQQYKWKGAPSTVALDSLVLVKNDFQPPCRWPLGRVLQLFPGKDGVSRIAEVKTLRGTVTRSLRHLCPLPAQNDIDN